MIASGDWELVVDAALGGSIAALRRRGVDILRSTPPGSADPLTTGSFPLVPYVNRIAGGELRFAGEVHRLPPTMAGHANPLHGLGWIRPWTVTEETDDAIVITHDHAPDDHWPWAYAAEQRFLLADDGLRVTLALVNRATTDMPFGLGFHPYFAAHGVDSLRFHAEALWLSDEALIPVDRVEPNRLADWDAGERVRRDTLIDNSYEGWPGHATIRRADGDVTIAGENTPYLHLYMPPGADFFCAEPTNAIADAVNGPSPLVLAPGERRAVTMAILDA